MSKTQPNHEAGEAAAKAIYALNPGYGEWSKLDVQWKNEARAARAAALPHIKKEMASRIRDEFLLGGSAKTIALNQGLSTAISAITRKEKDASKDA